MAVALQWHVATNADQPVALATSRSAATGGGEKDIFLVVCDARQTQSDPVQEAADLARAIFDDYHAREAKSASANTARASSSSNNTNGVDSARDISNVSATERNDIAQWLADAITTSVRHKAQSSQIAQPRPAGATRFGDGSSDTLAQTTYAVVAAVIHRKTLYVARYGGGHVYLLRSGALQHLTDESFVGGANAAMFEPDLGQLDLAGEDRVLLCNDGFANAVYETQLRNVLRATPSSRRAAQTLLEVATRDGSSSDGSSSNDAINSAMKMGRNGYRQITSLAVADYVTGRAGVFPIESMPAGEVEPMTGPRRGAFRSLAAIAVLIALIGSAIFAVTTLTHRVSSPGSNGAAGAAPGAPGAPTATEFAGQQTKPTTAPHTPTATAAPTATPHATAMSVSAPVPTLSPTPRPTHTPAPTLTPTAEPSATPSPTLTPTRRPRPKPTWTPTAVPPTATQLPPTPAPTNTPVPPSHGGGGGGGGLPPPPPPPPPCPPGATCH